MTQKKVRHGTWKIFSYNFLPFILDKAMECGISSYATREEVQKENWRTYFEYTQSMADYLILQSKVFLRLALSTADPRRFDVDFFDELTDLMAKYMAPFFAKKDAATSNEEAIAQLKNVLFTKNPFIDNCRKKREQLDEKHAKRAAAQAEQAAITKTKRKRIVSTVNQYNQRVYAVRVDLEKQK